MIWWHVKKLTLQELHHSVRNHSLIIICTHWASLLHWISHHKNKLSLFLRSTLFPFVNSTLFQLMLAVTVNWSSRLKTRSNSSILNLMDWESPSQKELSEYLKQMKTMEAYNLLEKTQSIILQRTRTYQLPQETHLI